MSDNLMIAEAFNDFFVSIGPKLSAEIDHNALDLSENLGTSPVTLFALSEIREYEVFLLLSNLKTADLLTFFELLSGKIWKQDGT